MPAKPAGAAWSFGSYESPQKQLQRHVVTWRAGNDNGGRTDPMHVTAIELELLLSEVDCSMTNRIVYQARSGMDTQFVAIPKSSAKLSNNITE
jgi:hypothetical protein